jgi:uncharacterized membrane protein YkvI
MDMEKEVKEMEEKHIQKEFARKKMIQYIAYGLAMVVIVLVAVGKSGQAVSSSLYAWVLVGIAIAAILFSLYNWRCPSCKKYLGRRMGIKVCPECKAKLQD